jgi:hypothetical protein
MTPAAVELSRSQALIGLQREAGAAGKPPGHPGQRHAVAGQPYANRPQGTMESVKALTGEQLSAHLARLRDGLAAAAGGGRRRRSRARARADARRLRLAAARRLRKRR